MTVYPLSETNVYITSPTANIQRYDYWGEGKYNAY